MITCLLLFVIVLLLGNAEESRSNHSDHQMQKPKQNREHKDHRKHDPMNPFTISLEMQSLRNRSTDTPVAPNAESIKVVVCALMKREDEYVDEWITYNKYLGFDHIHIYDNDEKPSAHLASLPRKYNKFVDVYHFPAKSPQLRAYTHCGMRYKHDKVWVAYIDVDEFIVLRKHNTIKELLFDRVPFGGALSLNRIFFGSNHLLHYDARPVVQRFTRRKKGIDSLVKTISYLPDVTLFEIHYTLLRDGKNMFLYQPFWFVIPSSGADVRFFSMHYNISLSLLVSNIHLSTKYCFRLHQTQV